MTGASTILCRLHGADRPGITAGLMSVLAESGAELYDVEQMVVRGRLSLDVLFAVPEGRSTVKDILYYGWEAEMQVDFEVVDSPPSPPRQTAAITLVSSRIGPETFAAAAHAIAEAGANIDRIVRLSRYPVVSYELVASGGDQLAMQRNLGVAGADHGFDVAVQEERLARRLKRMVVLDVDSTLIVGEVIDMLAAEAGNEDPVSLITREAMDGKVDFETSLRERVALLAGLPLEAVESVVERIELTPGARTFVRTLKRLGMRVAIISGGFSVITDRLAAGLEVDHSVANTLEAVDGRLTGRVIDPIIDRAGKAEIMRTLAAEQHIPLDQVVAVGDGSNDLDMLAAAGLGIAFNARRTVREAADASLNVPYLDAVLFMLGIRGDEVDVGSRSSLRPVAGLPPV
ncbi:phosphoserine phosphatase SerB [soil metagenome]